MVGLHKPKETTPMWWKTCNGYRPHKTSTGDPEIGPHMGPTESGPILESVRFVKPATFEWRCTSQSVYRYALLRVDIDY